MARSEAHGAARSGIPADIDGSVGLKQPAQIALDASFIAAPDDLRDGGLAGRADPKKLLEVSHEDHGADHDQVPLRNRNGAHAVVPRPGCPPGDHAVDIGNQDIGIVAIGAPQVYYRRLLSLAAIGDVSIPGDQPEQHAEIFIAASAELTFARLNE